ncbi:MAG TPA: hypothetical protein VGK19_15455 [Capsulimonadaceae bacterium]|jgi:hypothetical protein
MRLPIYLFSVRLIALVLLTGAVNFAHVRPIRADLLVKPNDLIAVCTDLRPQQKMVSVDIEGYFLMCAPIEGVRTYEAGAHRESIESFMKRVDNDLKPLHPSIVLTSYGFDNGRNTPDSRSFTYYEPTYATMAVAGLKKLGVRNILLGSSSVADSKYFDSGAEAADKWNANLGLFRSVYQGVAQKENVQFVDLYTPLMSVMPKAKALYGENYHFGCNGAWDGYPSANAQLVMAYSFLKSLGCDGDIGTITLDLPANTATGSPGHKVLSSASGVVTIESTRYPFCFSGNPAMPESTSGTAALFPFNEDLNRYNLVVKGLRSDRAKVTWGTETREFTAAELATGVNLAAAFAAHTPFDAQFAKIDAAVWKRQEKHKTFNESYFRAVTDLKKMAPTQTDAIDKLGQTILVEDQHMYDAEKALVIPVQHTLKIEAITNAAK